MNDMTKVVSLDSFIRLIVIYFRLTFVCKRLQINKYLVFSCLKYKEFGVWLGKNQHNYKNQLYIFRKSKKRIETLFSQLCDHFMIRRSWAKTFSGFKTRILSKITSLTIIQYINIIQCINKYIFYRNINNLKIYIVKCITSLVYLFVKDTRHFEKNCKST